MSRKRFTEMNCPAARALDEIGDWWTLLIIREAFYGTRTFTGFQSRLGIARNILASRLATLVENGVLEKTKANPESGRYSYELTQKGRDLLPVLISLIQWANTWIFDDTTRPVEIVERKSGRIIPRMSVTDQNGLFLSIDDLRVVPGPGADHKTAERLARNGKPGRSSQHK